jgi:hypothetical protein
MALRIPIFDVMNCPKIGAKMYARAPAEVIIPRVLLEILTSNKR